MAWYRNPTRLWSIIGLLVAGSGWQVLGTIDRPSASTDLRTKTVAVESPACTRAVKAGRRVAKAAGTALYVAPDVTPLVRRALAAETRAQRKNVREHLGALAPALRQARSFSESGDPPAWWRFRKWSARCLGEPEIPGSYVPPSGNPDGVRVMVRRFMEARLRGDGALRFVAPESRDEFGRAGGLAPLYPRLPLKDFEIAFVDGPLGGPSYEVGVELVFLQGSYGDTLFVSFQDDRYVITGGRPGLTGP